jgi:hypothetical protein
MAQLPLSFPVEPRSEPEYLGWRRKSARAVREQIRGWVYPRRTPFLKNKGGSVAKA